MELPYKFQVGTSEYSLEECDERCVDDYAFPILKDGKHTGLFLYLRLQMQDYEEPVCEIRDADEVQYIELGEPCDDPELIDEWLDSLDLPIIMEIVEKKKSSIIKGAVEDGNFNAVRRYCLARRPGPCRKVKGKRYECKTTRRTAQRIESPF